LKTQTQDNGESLQEFATTIEQLTHHAFFTPREDHIRRGPGKVRVFGDATGDPGIKQQLHLGGKNTPALRQTLKLEVIKLLCLPSGSIK
jgi:hypothetical protein